MHDDSVSDAPLLASVVVCTYNRAAFVRRALDALLAQPGLADDCEVIVVDNNSTDDTAAVVAEIAGRHPVVRYVSEPKQGLSHARNCGAAEARAPFVAYLDDDAIVQQTWIDALRAVRRSHPEARVIGGPIYPDFPTPPPRWFDPGYVTRTFREGAGPLQGLQARLGFSGGNMVIEKALLEAVGGFDPALGMAGARVHFGEETDLFFRIYERVGNVTYNHPGLAVWHHEPPEKLRWRYLARRIFANAALFAPQSRAAMGEPKATVLSVLKAGKQAAEAVARLPLAPITRYGWFRAARAAITAAGVLRGIAGRAE